MDEPRTRDGDSARRQPSTPGADRGLLSLLDRLFGLLDLCGLTGESGIAFASLHAIERTRPVDLHTAPHGLLLLGRGLCGNQ